MKLAKLTLDGYFNYGNILQNYALEQVLLRYADQVETIWHIDDNFSVNILRPVTLKRVVKWVLNWKGARDTSQDIWNRYEVVRSTEAFAFSAEARVRLRQEFHDEGKLIVGHVGSFYAEKNHAFLLRVFAALRRQREDAVLWLVGDCETERGLGVEMRALAKSLGIASSVRFLGKRKDVSACLSAMDVFIFPSKSEGLGTAFLEAQAAGLLAIGSDRLPEEVQVLDSVRFMSLEASPEEWADRVLQMLAENGQSREQAAASFRVSPYDSAHAVPALIDMYEAFVKQDPKEGR